MPYFLYLISNFRGCGKTLTAPTGNGSHYHVSYNYLPPGLREMEAKKYVSNSSLESAGDAYVSSTSELELSADPMNSILDPNAVIIKQSKKEVLPKKKYFTVALHLEWIMYRGKAQVYEICIQGQDMTNLELFVVPYDLKKETELMERLGFTFNKNLDKYYFVQPGVIICL